MVLVAVIDGEVVKEGVLRADAVCVIVPDRVLEGVLVGVCVLVIVLDGVIVLEDV
jgi:hypothetical protein